MDEKTFKARTKKLAVAIIKQVDKLPRSLATDVIARQLVRSGTSIGAGPGGRYADAEKVGDVSMWTDPTSSGIAIAQPA